MRKASRRERQQLGRFRQPAVLSGYQSWTNVSSTEISFLDAASIDSARVLDLGCGAGRVGLFVSPKAAMYVGVDQSPEMLNIAISRTPHGSYVCSDFFEYSPGSDGFDVVLLMHNTIDTVHPFGRRLELLRRIGTWLLPGGRLVFSSHVPRISAPSGLVGLERATGFILSMFCSLIGHGYVPEDYHGYTVWQYRARRRVIQRHLQRAGLCLIQSRIDDSRRPSDWTYYLAERVS